MNKDLETGNAYENGVSANNIGAVETQCQAAKLGPAENYGCSEYHFCCRRSKATEKGSERREELSMSEASVAEFYLR